MRIQLRSLTTRLVTVTLLLGIHSFSDSPARGQVPLATDRESRLQWVDELFNGMESRGISAAVCAIIQDDTLVHSRGYGVESRESLSAISPSESLFYLASVTKVLTATTIMRLVDRGTLSLDKDIRHYLQEDPQLALLPNSSPVTLRHLLTHTAGLDDRNIGMAVATAERQEPLSSYLARALPRQVRPAGSVTMYDNHGWALAGLAAERAAGRSWFELLQGEVLEPLEMRHSQVARVSGRDAPARFIDAYVTRREANQLVWRRIIPTNRQTTPAGSTWATADDMVRFMHMQLNGGLHGDFNFLSSQAIEEMQRVSWRSHPEADGLTPGFWERSIRGHRALLIMGSAPEGTSMLALIPTLKLGVFLAAARQDPSYLQPILQELMERLVPEREAPVTLAPPSAWQRRAGEICGEYFLLRFSQNSLETLAKWQAWIQVDTVGAGTIRTVDSFGEEREYQEVAEYLFRQADKPGFISFQPDASGEISWATTTDGFGFGDGWGFPNSFQKASWFERIGLKLTVLLSSACIFVTVVIAYPLCKLLDWCLAHANRRTRFVPPGFRLHGIGMWSMAACGLTGMIGVALLLANPDQLAPGMPAWSLVPRLAWLFFCALLPINGLLTGLAWKEGAGSLVARIGLTLVLGTAVILTPFLWQWNLIAWSY